MKTKLIVPFVKFYDAIKHSKRLEDKDLEYSYKVSAKKCAFWYRDRHHDPKLDGTQDKWWPAWIDVAKPMNAEGRERNVWNKVCRISRGNISKLEEGSGIHYAAIVHYRLHATADTRAQKFAKLLDYRAFGEPAEETIGKICEFVEASELDGVTTLDDENRHRSLINVSGLRWTELPANNIDRGMAMDLTFDIFEQEIGNRFYMYGTTRAAFEIKAQNFEATKFSKSSRRELPNYILDNNRGRYTAIGPKDDFGFLFGNAISDIVCIVTPKSSAGGSIRVSTEVMRYNLDVRSIDTSSNVTGDEDDDERVNLIDRLVCVLLNKRFLEVEGRNIKVSQITLTE